MRAGTLAGCVIAGVLSVTAEAIAADIYVPANGSLQSAVNAAQPGDTIYLVPGATYRGSLKLPVHGGTRYITIRSAASDDLLPPAGARTSPAYSAYLPKIKSATEAAAVRMAHGAAYWRLLHLELQANAKGAGDILQLGDGSTAQDTLEKVAHHLIVDRVYVHGDPLIGQKRGIALNSGQTTIINSWIADIKAIGQDSQAIGGWNGPGPYRIENNYLEAAGEVFLLGGADPAIPDLTPTDVLVRGNTLSRPLAWRQPFIATPTDVRGSIVMDGSLPAGTYGYQVVARRRLPSGEMARSLPASEVAVTVADGARIALTWPPVPDATEYVVYGRTPRTPERYWLVTAPAFEDDGRSLGTAGTPKATGTVWQVKNLLELKNSRRVQIDFNVLEHNWAQAQTGIAVLFTPRNQNGRCPWCVVEDVTFEYNIVRGVAGGINVLGWDNERPSQQTNNIRIRHNQFSDLRKSWGGNAYFLYVLGQPRDLIVDHNTISSNGSGVVQVDSPPMSGFVFTNNLAKHNAYGVIGADRAPGMHTIAYFFPDGVITRNVLAGGKASVYPAGNGFPTTTEFEAHFVDYVQQDLALVPGTPWARAGTDGLDLGADITALRAYARPTDGDTPRIVTAAMPVATEDAPYLATLDAAWGIGAFQWRIVDGALPEGIALDPFSGRVSGVPLARGDYAFMLEVTDAAGTTARRPLILHVDPRIPPIAIVTDAALGGTTTRPYMQAFVATGGRGGYTWAVAGALPAGLTFSPDGVLAGIPEAMGNWTFTLTAIDTTDPTRQMSRTYTLLIEPPPNAPLSAWRLAHHVRESPQVRYAHRPCVPADPSRL